MPDFAALYAEHFAGVYRFLCALCRSHALAEELTQETFYKAMKSYKRFRGDASCYGWLCQIAKNAYFSHLRREKAAPGPVDQAAFPTGDALDALLAAERLSTLHQALHQLTEPYKEVFTLRIFAELPYADIARLFQQREGWARVVFYRAKAMLAKACQEEI